MQKLYILINTQINKNVKHNKKESNKRTGNANIHTLDNIIHDGNENPPEIEALYKAYQAIKVMQEAYDEQNAEVVGLKYVVEEFGKREEKYMPYIEALHKKIDWYELTRKKAGDVKDALDPSFETFIRSQGKQMDDDTFGRIKGDFTSRYLYRELPPIRQL